MGLRREGSHNKNPLLPDNVMGGWQVFARKQCIECHAVWGLGAQMGPDLGRTEEAVTYIKRILETDPDRGYFKRQLTRFEKILEEKAGS